MKRLIIHENKILIEKFILFEFDNLYYIITFRGISAKS